jgi:hypothetical protein
MTLFKSHSRGLHGPPVLLQVVAGSPWVHSSPISHSRGHIVPQLSFRSSRDLLDSQDLQASVHKGYTL